MLRTLLNSLFGRHPRRARRNFRIEAAEHQTELLEARTVLSPLSIVADLDGVPAMEVASLENNRLVIRSAVGLPERTYNVGAFNRIHAADLDSKPGSELLLTNLQTVGTQIQESRATVVS